MLSLWRANDDCRDAYNADDADRSDAGKKFGRLEGDVQTDVLVIGGGMAGVLCAYALAENGVDCLLAEADRLGRGVTGNTTAKITVQHGLIYGRLIREHGVQYARDYYLANKRALDTYRAMCGKLGCNIEEKDSFVYTTGDVGTIEQETEACRKIGIDADTVTDLEIPVGRAAVRVRGQAQFDPLEFIRTVSRDLNVCENTFVKKIDGTAAFTDSGKITARKIVFCTHFPFVNRHGFYPLKLYQHRSYVAAFENAPDVGGMYVDECRKGFSFRGYNGLLLVGGGAHRTGEDGGGYDAVMKFAEEHFPQARLKYRWSTQDCMSLDGVPYIGHYSAYCPDWYAATGFNKWGMTSSMIAAQNICDLILKRKNPYFEVFSPSRSILTKQLFINAGKSAAGLLSFGKKRCPHLGCALEWDPHEHSWDCPCHGSRFSQDGKLINNPAMKGIDTK